MTTTPKPAPAPEAPKLSACCAYCFHAEAEHVLGGCRMCLDLTFPRCTGFAVQADAPMVKLAPAPEPKWDNTTVCFGSDCPNCEREKASPEPKHHKYISSPDRGGCVFSVEGHYCGMHRLAPVHRAPEPKQGSEEPIDLPTWDLPLAEPGISSRLSDESIEKLAYLMATETSWDHAKVNAHADELARAYRALRAELAQAREEIAKLRTEMSKLPQSETVAARYPTNSMCASGHQMVLWMDEDFERCPVCRAEARVKELESKILAWSGLEHETCSDTCTCGYGCPHGAGCMSLCNCKEWEPPTELYEEARAILAARAKEGEKR